MLLLALRALAERLPHAPFRRGLPVREYAGRRLRVAIVSEFYFPHLGGVCEHIYFFARELRRRGHHVDVITAHMEGEETEPNVIRMGRSIPVQANGSCGRFTLGLDLGRRMRRTLERGRYDIVHLHSPLTPTLPMVAIQYARCPVVASFHTHIVDRSRSWDLFNGFLQERLDRVDAKIAVSMTAAHSVDKHFRVDDWSIIPNGIDTELFTASAPPPPGVRADLPYILFMHRLEARNGLHTLLAAFRELRATGRRAQLVVVGDGPDAERHRRDTAGEPDITFVGALHDGRPSYYAHAAVYACPTTVGTFGITLLESMSCGTPVVCSDITGFREVVTHEREALFFPCHDSHALAQALARLLDDAGLRERMGKAGRRRALEFDWSTVADSVLEVYGELVGERVVWPRPSDAPADAGAIP